MPSHNNGLIVFIKNPQLGKVKTRIAKDLGDADALLIYMSLLEHTRKVVSNVDALKYLYYSNWIVENDKWPNEKFAKNLQEGNSLGERMAHAFAHTFQNHNKVIIIGSDCIQLTSKIIDDAYRTLDNYDIVIGPAEDGGYYMLGMRTYSPQLFDNMTWSHDKVLQDTIDRAEQSKLTYNIAPTLSDIDHAADWDKYKHLL